MTVKGPTPNVDPKWRDQAACIGYLTDTADPWCSDDRAMQPPKWIADLCAACPVRRDCLVDALWHRDGCIRGGLTARRRASLLRARDRTRCPVCQSLLPATVADDEDRPVQVCWACGLSWRTTPAAAQAAAHN